jgi:pilus assembly protein Flp/PilA
MQFTPKERGQGLVEYALILVLVVLVVIVILYFLGVSINDLWENTVTPLCDVFAPGLCP